jgi:hypothetical protein
MADEPVSDITGTRIILPSPIEPGETSEIQDFIRNQGSASASPFQIEYYLTSHPEQTGEKIFIGRWDVPGLKAGAGKSGNITITVPPDTKPGEYVLFRSIDPDSDLTGEISSNNVQSSKNPIIITARKTPGLHGIGTILPGVAKAGDLLPVMVIIGNNQKQETESITMYLFLSPATEPDHSGIEVGTVRIPPVPAEEELKVNGTIQIPGDTLAGEYYLFTSFIPMDSITRERDSSLYWFNEDPIRVTTGSDSQETDPETAIPTVSKNPDADVVGLETIIPGEAFIGGSFQIMDTMQNIGGASANIVRVQYTLSRNTEGTNGVHLGYWTIMGLKPGQVVQETKILGVPSGIDPGPYYLTKKIMVTGSSTGQAHDAFWVSSQPIHIKYNPADPIPELTHVMTIWPTGQSGGPVPVTDTITNIGRGCANGVSVAYYISPHQQFDPVTATYLGVWKIDAICPGEQKTEVTPISIPPGLPYGEYYLYSVINPCWFVSECGEGSPELDTSNNINIGRFNIGPCVLCN